MQFSTICILSVDYYAGIGSWIVSCWWSICVASNSSKLPHSRPSRLIELKSYVCFLIIYKKIKTTKLFLCKGILILTLLCFQDSVEVVFFERAHEKLFRQLQDSTPRNFHIFKVFTLTLILTVCFLTF